MEAESLRGKRNLKKVRKGKREEKPLDVGLYERFLLVGESEG